MFISGIVKAMTAGAICFGCVTATSVSSRYGASVSMDVPIPHTKQMQSERRALKSKPLTRPFLWKVEKDSVLRGYLFGTVHVGVCLGDLPITYLRQMDSVDKLLVEGHPDNEAPAETDVIRELQTSTDGKLSERLSPTSWHLLKTNVFYPPKLIETLTPRSAWYVLQATTEARVTLGMNSNCSLDHELRLHAREQKKPILFLETREEMKQAWNAVMDRSMPPYSAAELDRYLEEELIADQQKKVMDYYNLIRAYQDGESAMISAYTSLDEKLERALLLNRNAAWVPRLIQEFDKGGTTLVVAGAAHFVGAGNVIGSLQQAGYAVARVER